VRAKALASGQFLDLSVAVVEAAQQTGATVIVNDRSDIAALSHAAGVHVGQDDLTPDQVVQVIGSDAIIGLSTHTPSQVAEAMELPISYLAMGPVFATSTKATGYDAVGPTAVARAAAAARSRGLPVVAIGGITLETAPTLIAAGAASVAVIGDLLAGDPETRAHEYLAALA
jgi:thiamine-phosphate pyrophosphorylase